MTSLYFHCFIHSAIPNSAPKPIGTALQRSCRNLLSFLRLFSGSSSQLSSVSYASDGCIKWTAHMASCLVEFLILIEPPLSPLLARGDVSGRPRGCMLDSAAGLIGPIIPLGDLFLSACLPRGEVTRQPRWCILVLASAADLYGSVFTLEELFILDPY